ncbi:SDR family oxidoreductase [Rhodobacteraceae bacterium NNCM2]|nr:SDR family oxidoreductase [Coraliihabitans acroporae]
MAGTCIVTGGSRGIGAASAVLAAEAGYFVVVNYANDKQSAEKVAAEIRQAGGQAITHQADVSDEKAVVEMFDRAEEELGPLTALINNAGILKQMMRLEDMDADRINRVIAVNITGSFLCAREAVRRFGDGGAIVNVSSRAAVLGSPDEFIDYAASKGAIDTMTIGLAKEVGSLGIRVNAVRPGLIDTDIHASGGDAGRAARLCQMVPMKRTGSAEEVAEVIVWLLSDGASYVNGSLIDVGGGR